MCLRGGSFFQFSKICLHFSAVCLQFFKKKPPPLKHILALPIWGQKCLVSEKEQIEKVNFDLGHPVSVILEGASNFVLTYHAYCQKTSLVS